MPMNKRIQNTIAVTMRNQSSTVQEPFTAVVLFVSIAVVDIALSIVQAAGQQPESQAYWKSSSRKAHIGVLDATFDPGVRPGVNCK